MRTGHFDVLIAGGGLAAQRCCETLRRQGFSGSVGVICEEPLRPYDRPPLSKAILAAVEEPRPSQLRCDEWYDQNEVELLLGVRACELDTRGSRVSVAERRGRTGTLRFERLVIATGSRPRQLEGITPGRGIHELRTYEDALRLRLALREREGPTAIIGAGLIGMEVASSARSLGREVTMIEAAERPLKRALPPALGRWITRFHRAHGVDVRLSTTVRRARSRAGETTLELSDGSRLHASTVLLGAGIEPATAWLASSGLGDGAVTVDHRGRTAVPRIFAAGDASSWMDPRLGRSVACQHWEAAARQGAAVARTIVGLPPERPKPSMFWSDQHGHRIQFLGHASDDCFIELTDETVACAPFTAWMYDRGGVCAALLVDSPAAIGPARQRIEQSQSPGTSAMAA